MVNHLVRYFSEIFTSWRFWLEYWGFMAQLSILLHIICFKRELSKPNPSIPYEQEFP